MSENKLNFEEQYPGWIQCPHCGAPLLIGRETEHLCGETDPWKDPRVSVEVKK